MADRRGAAGACVPGVILAAACLALTPGAKAPAPGGKAPLQDDEIVALLRDYLRIDTSNPPGNELKAARFFKDWFDREGISSEIFEIAPGRANLVARLKGNGSKRPLLLSSHMDVVNVERPYWSVDPFAGIEKDGFIYGRGALDMKSTGLLEAAAMVNVRRSGGGLSRDLIFLGTADEEVGAIGAQWVVDRRPDLVKGAEFMLNEGGVIDAVDGKARSYDVGVTEKCSLARLSHYETPLQVIPAADAYFKARAASQPAGRAEQYRNVREAIKDPEFLSTLEADPQLNAILRNTISITMLQGAPQTNIIPTAAEARVDIRLLPGQDPDAFLAEIRKVVEEPGVTVETIGDFVPATASPVESELMRAIDRARSRHDPDTVLAPTILTGWTESALMRPLGIQAYGFEPYVLEESEQNRAHGNDERISVDNVLRGARIMEEIVRDVSR